MDNGESREDYLERILMLQEQGLNEIHAIDLANFMNFSKPSVSIALKKLEAQGLVALGPKFQLYLTPEGLNLASKIYERHRIVGSLLIDLGVGEETAYKDACRIEHDISDETFAALKKHYKEKGKNKKKKTNLF
jgi:DtxR family transcriptional regulator, Mn-dependent transcriptional regulator